MLKLISLTLISLQSIILVACSSIQAFSPAFKTASTPTFPTQSGPILKVSAENQASSRPLTSPGEVVNIEFLENMVYEIQLIKEVLPETNGQTRLKEGYFEKAQPNSAASIIVKLIKSTVGDLNHDSLDDGIAVLSIETGGSGVFIYLIGVINQQGQPVQVAEYFLGDRIKIDSLRIEDAILLIDIQTHKETDPACCPTESITKKFVIEDQEFVEMIGIQ